jgi:hypothetical protein
VTLWSLMVLDCWLAGLRSGRLGRPPSLPDPRVRETGAG